MDHAAHIGRVGALAVALGVGVAVFAPPAVGHAEPSDSDTSTSTDSPSDTPDGDQSEGTESPHHGSDDDEPVEEVPADEIDDDAPDEDDPEAGEPEAGEPEADESLEPSEQAAEQFPSDGVGHEHDSDDTRIGLMVDHPARDSVDPAAVVADVESDYFTAAETLVVDEVDLTAEDLLPSGALIDIVQYFSTVEIDAAEEKPTVRVEPETVSQERIVTTQLAKLALAPLLALDTPGTPGPSPALWAVLAWARREFEHVSLIRDADQGTLQQLETSLATVGTLANVFHAAITSAQADVEQALSAAPILSALDETRNWFERTFFAASPTYPPQLELEALEVGETSSPFALGGVDADSKPLTYSVDGHASGVGTGGGTLTIDGTHATYTPPASWDGVTPYTDTFQVTATDREDAPHLHGLSGLLSTLTLGLIGNRGHAATGTVTVSVAPYSAGTFPVEFVNNSGHANDDVYITVIGQTSAGYWAWVDSDGNAHPIDHEYANAPGHLEKDGVNYGNMSYTLAEASTVTMPPELQGARIYISIDEPLYIAISEDNMGWTVPNPVQTTDPNYETIYDWYEFTYQYRGIPFGGNTTQVDQYGLPLSFTLTQGSYTGTRGTTSTDVYTTYLNSVPPEFAGLVIYDDQNNPIRIASPRSTQPGDLATYLDEPVDDFWTKYTTETFTFESPGAYTISGQVNASGQFEYTVTALSPDGVSGNYVMDKPTTAEVFAGNGPFVGTHEQGAFLAQLNAAFNRGVAASPDQWGTASAYYPDEVKHNEYAQVFHELGIDGKNYGFPYDDVNSQSSVLILDNSQPPGNLTITIN